MTKAVRAIIIEGKNILVMYRNKYGSEYYTLVGGRTMDGETAEQALVREVKEETGLEVISARQVYIEEHPAPYNEQYIFLCQVAPHTQVQIQESSEEGFMNRLGANMHTPVWATLQSFPRLAFRTPQLHAAIVKALKKGFPNEPVKL